jgi:hypothetical protein
MSFRRISVQRLCLLSLLLIAIALSVVACSGSSSPSNPGGAPTATSSGY